MPVPSERHSFLTPEYLAFTQRVEAFTALLVEYAAVAKLPLAEQEARDADILRRMEAFRTPPRQDSAT